MTTYHTVKAKIEKHGQQLFWLKGRKANEELTRFALWLADLRDNLVDRMAEEHEATDLFSANLHTARMAFDTGMTADQVATIWTGVEHPADEEPEDDGMRHPMHPNSPSMSVRRSAR